MPRSICKADFRDVHAAMREMKRKVRSVMSQVGREAVDYAVEHGSYHDVTGHLRSSNKAEVEGDKLKVYNDAEYAAEVEARGYEVVSGAALFAEKRLKEIFE